MTATQLRTWATRLDRSMGNLELDRKGFSCTLNSYLEAGRSAAEFAEATNVSPQYMSDLRKGRRVPSRDFLERVIRATA